ncbi:MAG: hypothetical protein PHN18_12940 [Sulfurospirillaceae bacterium]|nr:hypothetical protein [Sulfurospirillaceae bacterium]MDD2827768.1 hypothetical protein [Sulfurospirillaceae bacterium]
MHDRFLFGFYCLGLGIILSSHSLVYLSTYAFICLLLAKKEIFILLKRALKSILVFNLVISIGYIVTSMMQQRVWIDYILMFNIRVFDLTLLTFLFTRYANIAQALSFSKTLSFLWTISLSQIISYQKSYENFKLSLKSRVIKKMSERSQKEFIASAFGYFFKKALYDSEEKSLALKARGLFD